jgi:hypothetical protein
MTLVISVSVVTENHEHAVRASEAFARAATGLCLDGITASVTLGVVDDDDDEDDT